MRVALSDPALLANALPGRSWAGWRALLIAAAGEPLDDTERALFTKLTGREREPADGVLAECFLMIGGRRGGKSKAVATLCAWLASCIDWSDCLSIGERGRVLFVAPTVDQARVMMDYTRALFHDNELLHSLVENELADELHLKGRIIFEIQPASAAHGRGKTAVAICLDESAFLKSGDAVNNDEDLVTALRPSLATTGGPLLLTSSPAGAEGLVYQLYKRHFGAQGDARCIVAKGSSRDLNPSLRQSVVDRAYEEDPDSAAAEYGAEFREPQTAYITREIVERCIERGTGPRVRVRGVQYFAHVDPSTGVGRDSFGFVIGHKVHEGERDTTVIDFIYEKQPPFDPLAVVAEICGALQAWGITEVMGDQAGKPLITAFARGGIKYRCTPISTSEVYMHALPAWTSGSVCLFDGVERVVRQLVGLRRKLGQAGREIIDHAKSVHAHDDLAVCICGVIYQATPIEFNAVDIASLQGIGVFSQPRAYAGEASGASETMSAWLRTQNYGRAPDGGLGRGNPVRRGYVW
jgi:hypothetical protein